MKTLYWSNALVDVILSLLVHGYEHCKRGMPVFNRSG